MASGWGQPGKAASTAARLRCVENGVGTLLAGKVGWGSCLQHGYPRLRVGDGRGWPSTLGAPIRAGFLRHNPSRRGAPDRAIDAGKGVWPVQQDEGFRNIAAACEKQTRLYR